MRYWLKCWRGRARLCIFCYTKGVIPIEEKLDSWPSGSPQFQTTQWGLVLSAANTGDGQAVALEQLCRVYWYPIYAYVRWRGHAPPDAQDLTQEFFARLLEKHW